MQLAFPLNQSAVLTMVIVDADLLHGLPISLQLVARRLEEEKAIAMTRYVLRCLKGSS